MSFVATLNRTKDVTHLLHFEDGGVKKRNKKGKETHPVVSSKLALGNRRVEILKYFYVSYEGL